MRDTLLNSKNDKYDYAPSAFLQAHHEAAARNGKPSGQNIVVSDTWPKSQTFEDVFSESDTGQLSDRNTLKSSVSELDILISRDSSSSLAWSGDGRVSSGVNLTLKTIHGSSTSRLVTRDTRRSKRSPKRKKIRLKNAKKKVKMLSALSLIGTNSTDESLEQFENKTDGKAPSEETAAATEQKFGKSESSKNSSEENRVNMGKHASDVEPAVNAPSPHQSAMSLSDLQEAKRSDVSGTKTMLQMSFNGGEISPTQLVEVDGKKINISVLIDFLKEKEFKKQLNQQAQWAYLCMVALICLMMFTMWYLGGFDRCRYRPDSHTHFTDAPHLLPVHEVLRRKEKYLPMFNEPEWDEVLMEHRGTDP